MDPSPKRRRVSLTRSVSISPIKIAADNALLAPLTSTLRPSYASPTRSSLARTNPALLPPPRRSVGGLDGTDNDIFDMGHIGKEKRRSKLNPTPLRTTTPNRGSPTPPIRSSMGRAGGGGRSQRSSRGSRKRVSFATAGDIGEEAVSVGQENMPIEETVISQLSGEASPDIRDDVPGEETTSMEADFSMMADENGEPMLPKLPTPEIPLAPPGLLSSSPSGKAARRLTMRRSILPTANRRESANSSIDIDARDARKDQDIDQAVDEPGYQAGEDVDEEEGARPRDQTEDTEHREDETDGLDETEEIESDGIPLHPSGPIILHDLASGAKQDELAGLLRRRERLTKDVDTLEDALMAHDSGRQSNSEAVLDIILRVEQIPEDVQHTSILGQQLIAKFLPFTSSRVRLPTVDVSASEKVEVPTSLSAEVFGMFTPLHVKCNQQAVFFEDKHVQRSVLDITSADELLTIGLDVDIDPEDGRIFQIGSHGEWCEWSKLELLGFCRQHLGGEYGPSTCDINAIGRAASSFWELANLRAKTWRACIQDHSDLVAGVSVVDTDPNSALGDAHIKRLHLGRQNLRLEKDGVGLLISWKITFDWTGEARSNVSACAAFPISWRQRDDASSFDHVDELLDLFLRRFGIRHAVNNLTELLFGRSD